MISNLHAEILATSLSGTIWHLTWSGSGGAIYRIVVDGVVIGSTSATWWDLLVTSGQPVIDVLDDPAAVPAPVIPNGVQLAWYSAGAGVKEYRIDRQVAADWIEQDRVPEAWYQVWASGKLPDDTSAAFRIVPVGLNGNDGTPAEFVALVVRNPDEPAVDFEYDKLTGVVTISAA